MLLTAELEKKKFGEFKRLSSLYVAQLAGCMDISLSPIHKLNFELEMQEPID